MQVRSSSAVVDRAATADAPPPTASGGRGTDSPRAGSDQAMGSVHRRWFTHARDPGFWGRVTVVARTGRCPRHLRRPERAARHRGAWFSVLRRVWSDCCGRRGLLSLIAPKPMTEKPYAWPLLGNSRRSSTAVPTPLELDPRTRTRLPHPSPLLRQGCRPRLLVAIALRIAAWRRTSGFGGHFLSHGDASSVACSYEHIIY